MFNDNIIKISSCCKKHYVFIADQMAKKVAFNETQQITIFHTIWCSPHAKLCLVCILRPLFLQFDNITHFPFAGVILLYILPETYCVLPVFAPQGNMIVNTIFNQTESYFSLRVLLKEMSFDSRATDDLTLLNDLLNLGQVLFRKQERL